MWVGWGRNAKKHQSDKKREWELICGWTDRQDDERADMTERERGGLSRGTDDDSGLKQCERLCKQSW